MRIPAFKTPNFKTHLPEAFSIAGLRGALARLAKRGGHKVLSSALTLYYCLRDSETPTWAKTVIAGALGYLIFPLDMIPDAILGAGFTDDWSVILGALAAVVTHIKPEHKDKAAALADRFLGEPDGVELDEIPVPGQSV